MRTLIGFLSPIILMFLFAFFFGVYYEIFNNCFRKKPKIVVDILGFLYWVIVIPFCLFIFYSCIQFASDNDRNLSNDDDYGYGSSKYQNLISLNICTNEMRGKTIDNGYMAVSSFISVHQYKCLIKTSSGLIIDESEKFLEKYTDKLREYNKKYKQKELELEFNNN